MNQTGDCLLEKWSLEERQNRSQVVFTAVIESCSNSKADESTEPIDERHQEVCQRNLQQQSIETADSDDGLALLVRMKKIVKGLDRKWEGRLVRVEGLGDPRICPSRVRLRDTRIFLTSYVNQASNVETVDPSDHRDVDHHHQSYHANSVIRLRLNSSLMAVSLRHLQQLRAFSKGSFRFSFIKPSFMHVCAVLFCVSVCQCVVTFFSI